MIKEYRIENLRSLVDTGFVPIRPITILLGKNSSGKSTFLRSFPLYTQSVSKQLRNAFAWFDTTLVDFGDYVTARSIFNPNNPIKFSFKIDHKQLEAWCEAHMGSFRRWDFYDLHPYLLFPGSEMTLTYAPKTDGKGDMLTSVEFNFEYENSVKFEFKEKGQVSLIVNGANWTLGDINWSNSESGEFLPVLFNSSKRRYGRFFPNFRLLDETVKPLKKYCSSKTSHFDNLKDICRYWTLNKWECLHKFQTFDTYKTLQKKIGDWTVDTPVFKEVYNNLLGLNLLSFWFELSSALGSYFTNCEYVAPLRAEANRYYRNQGLQVSRIDAYGRNLSEFISSLTPTQKESYDEFIKNTLRIKVYVRNSGGHQSMTISTLKRDGDKEFWSEEANIADMGFGYSQILPILTKLWHMQERTRFNSLAFYGASGATALIEQPELHLHPGLQALLADVFVRAAINTEAKSAVVVETHSTAIINRIGRRIREGHIPSDQVSVVLFEKDKDGKTNVCSTEFDEDGRLLNWPYGFFEPSDDIF